LGLASVTDGLQGCVPPHCASALRTDMEVTIGMTEAAMVSA
jgi:hypothetical protein